MSEGDFYFLSNQSEKAIYFEATFRIASNIPELWNLLTQDMCILPQYIDKNGSTTILLRMEVVNNWMNRLIGDQHLPEDQRPTWTLFSPWKADSPLQSSGLLGPVRVMAFDYTSCF